MDPVDIGGCERACLGFARKNDPWSAFCVSALDRPALASACERGAGLLVVRGGAAGMGLMRVVERRDSD